MRHDSTRQRLEQPRLNFNEEAIKAEYKNLMHDGNHKAIRILLILGSLLSSAFVLGLLSVLGLYDTPGAMLTVGLAGLVSGVWIHRMGKKDVLDAFSVSFVVIGYASFLFSISEWRGSATEVCVAAGLLSAALFFFTRSYLLPFLSVVSFLGSGYVWIMLKEMPLLAPVLSFLSILLLWAIYQREGETIGRFRRWNTHYAPLCLGLLVSVLAAQYLFIPLFEGVLIEGLRIRYPMYFSLPNSMFCAITLYRVIPEMGVESSRSKMLLLVGMLIILALTLSAPSFSLSLFLLLVTFRNAHQTGIILSIISLIAAIGIYYYDLQLSLLTKSILLIACGALFLLGFRAVDRQLNKQSS
jgi:hypothetical protein